MRLGDFVENPDNPQTVTDQAFEKIVRLVEKNPDGLKADRIAYVTDHPAGKFVVLSGNKRLRALKRIHGDDFDAPADWFQDITGMSDDQRDEFIVDANINEGRFDADKLLALYDRDELTEWVGEDRIGQLISVVESSPDVAASPQGGASADAVKMVDFKIVLSSAEYKEATERLRKLSDDTSTAFMRVINGKS